MSMIGNYLRVTKEELEEYLAYSSKLENRVYNESDPADKNLIDVDKSWEGLFFLLTGKSLSTADEAATPLVWILTPPNEIDPEQDMGYGPATYTTIEQTKEISHALNKISGDELRAKYDGQLMMELGIYPEIWNGTESLDYLIEYFNLVRNFYSKAAAQNQAVIIFMN